MNWKEVVVGIALGIVSLSSLIHIKRFLTGEDTAVINVYNPKNVEVADGGTKRVIDLEAIANGSAFEDTDEDVE